MKFKVFYGPMPNLKASDKDMFSKPNSECVALYLDNKERPVIVSKVLTHRFLIESHLVLR